MTSIKMTMTRTEIQKQIHFFLLADNRLEHPSVLDSILLAAEPGILSRFDPSRVVSISGSSLLGFDIPLFPPSRHPLME